MTRNGSAYVAVHSAHSSLDPSSSPNADWTLFAARGADGATGPTGATGPQGIQGPDGPPGPPVDTSTLVDLTSAQAITGTKTFQSVAASSLTVNGAFSALNGLEIVQTEDARLSYVPNDFSCAPAGAWCSEHNNWGVNRFSTNGRYTNCGSSSSSTNCSGNSIVLALNNNQYRSVLFSHLDWTNTGAIDVYLSFDGGTAYTFTKQIRTTRNVVQSPYTSAIRTVVTNLPLGVNVRIKLVAALGRMHFEGFGLVKITMPESVDDAGASCANGFTAINNGRLCVSPLQAPAPFYQAAAVCQSIAPGVAARVGTQADALQACGAGMNYFGNAFPGWFGDHGPTDDTYHTWNANSCSGGGNVNVDGAPANALVPALYYRCTY